MLPIRHVYAVITICCLYLSQPCGATTLTIVPYFISGVNSSLKLARLIITINPNEATLVYIKQMILNINRSEGNPLSIPENADIAWISRIEHINRVRAPFCTEDIAELKDHAALRIELQEPS